jgi:hypothetical protein
MISVCHQISYDIGHDIFFMQYLSVVFLACLALGIKRLGGAEPGNGSGRVSNAWAVIVASGAANNKSSSSGWMDVAAAARCILRTA